jgi:HEPN domain-containing protein
MAHMAPKPKVEVAREHLSKAQEEAGAGDLRDAVQWSFASLEAAIDALAAKHGIRIDEQHWRRRDAAHELMLKSVLPRDLSGLHQLLNEERKAMFYEGEDPELGELSINDVLSEVETAVKTAEADTE